MADRRPSPLVREFPGEIGGRELVIFDLDGTIANTRQAMEQAFVSAYRQEVGVGEPPVDQFFLLLGGAFPTILETLGLPQSMSEVFRERSRALVSGIAAYDGAVESVVQLRHAGFATAILTGKDRERAIELLDHLGVSALFDAVATSSDDFEPKPSPDGVFWLCERLLAEPTDAVVVGDSPFDIRAGRAAGAATVACAWGISPVATLEDAGADRLIDDPHELAAVVEELVKPVGRVSITGNGEPDARASDS